MTYDRLLPVNIPVDWDVFWSLQGYVIVNWNMICKILQYNLAVS